MPTLDEIIEQAIQISFTENHSVDAISIINTLPPLPLLIAAQQLGINLSEVQVDGSGLFTNSRYLGLGSGLLYVYETTDNLVSSGLPPIPSSIYITNLFTQSDFPY